MSANGTFDIDLTPQQDDGYPAGRMLIKKTYQGDMSGSGIGQMISKRTENGAAVYYAVEEFSGSVKDKNGGFTLVHKGHMGKESQSLEGGAGADWNGYLGLCAEEERWCVRSRSSYRTSIHAWACKRPSEM